MKLKSFSAHLLGFAGTRITSRGSVEIVDGLFEAPDELGVLLHVEGFQNTLASYQDLSSVDRTRELSAREEGVVECFGHGEFAGAEHARYYVKEFGGVRVDGVLLVPPQKSSHRCCVR